VGNAFWISAGSHPIDAMRSNFNLLITNSRMWARDWGYDGSWIRMHFHDNKLEIGNNTTRMMNEYYGEKMI